MPLVLQLTQLVWALDLRLHYSDSMAMFQLTGYVTQGQFNARDHTFSINPPKTQKRQRRRRLAGVEEEVGTSVLSGRRGQILHTILLRLFKESYMNLLCEMKKTKQKYVKKYGKKKEAQDNQ